MFRISEGLNSSLAQRKLLKSWAKNWFVGLVPEARWRHPKKTETYANARSPTKNKNPKPSNFL